MAKLITGNQRFRTQEVRIFLDCHHTGGGNDYAVSITYEDSSGKRSHLDITAEMAYVIRVLTPNFRDMAEEEARKAVEAKGGTQLLMEQGGTDHRINIFDIDCATEEEIWEAAVEKEKADKKIHASLSSVVSAS